MGDNKQALNVLGRQMWSKTRSEFSDKQPAPTDAQLQFHIRTTRAVNSANDSWRSGVSCGCCTRLERSPGLCQDVLIVYGAQTTAENATVQGILW